MPTPGIAFKRCFLFAFILLIVSPSFAQGWDTVNIKLTKLTPTVHMMEGRGGNIGLCVGGDGTFIIDDQFAPLSDKIITAIGTVTGKPVQFVINTHFHGDHAGGNTNFGNKGAIIVSHENARKRLEADSFFKAQAVNNPNISPAGLPKITFTQSMTFHYNKETVRIFHIADAHTDGDAIIWFKESNVLHMGDVFVRYGLPYIDMPSGGNINGMIETINYVIKEIDDKTVIIPGHGQLSGKQDLVAYNTMLTTIRDRVKKLIDEGKSYDDIIKAKPISDIEKRETNANTFIKVVYDSQLRKYN
ncbi:MAG: MBL fold metallo-hydrolase [Bacteroidia bacterium]|nr:MBL fold metallo-hydrolase [Bacteroidia bacterium]